MTNRETLEELILRLIAETAEDVYMQSKTTKFGESILLVININREAYDTFVTATLYDNGERIVTALYDSSEDDINYEFDALPEDEQANKIINTLSRYLGEIQFV